VELRGFEPMAIADAARSRAIPLSPVNARRLFTKHTYGQMAEATPKNAVAFLDRLVAEFPQKIDALSTYIGSVANFAADGVPV
jgi:hypothetical protein